MSDMIERVGIAAKKHLTDEEIDALWRDMDFITHHPPGVERHMSRQFARAVIAKIEGAS